MKKKPWRFLGEDEENEEKGEEGGEDKENKGKETVEGGSDDDDDAARPAKKKQPKKRQNKTLQAILELASDVVKEGKEEKKLMEAAMVQDAEIRELKKQLLQEQVLRMRAERPNQIL